MLKYLLIAAAIFVLYKLITNERGGVRKKGQDKEERKEKERKKEIDTMRAGCKVLFSGGIIGTITEVKDATKDAADATKDAAADAVAKAKAAGADAKKATEKAVEDVKKP